MPTHLADYKEMIAKASRLKVDLVEENEEIYIAMPGGSEWKIGPFDSPIQVLDALGHVEFGMHRQELNHIVTG